MSEETTIEFAALELPSDGVAVILAEDRPALSPLGRKLDDRSDGAISRAMQITKFKGKKDSSVDLLVPAGLTLSRLLVFGAGKLDEYGNDDWINLGGAIRGALSGREGPTAQIILEAANGKSDLGPEDVAEFALGTMLRGYTFKKYKSDKKLKNASDADAAEEKGLRKIVIRSSDPKAAEKAFAARRAIGAGVATARDLVNEPANILGPEEFANRAKALEKDGLTIEVLEEAELERLGMNSLLAVGKGSVQPSFVVVMQWNGAGDDSDPVVFVGKGVTFDAGGISIKAAAGMEDMKGDMAGAACVTGLMQALAARKAKVNAIGILGLVENMPSGAAQRPGDVVAAMSGQTIEVLNTDAEGRMVLADALWYAQDRFKPRFVIDLATLTGAVMVALGKEHAGLFSNNDALSDELIATGKTTGEKLWRLPLGPKYEKLIESKIADIKNTGGRWGGSITAAQFLQRFVKDDVPWAHLDIAGTGLASPDTDISRSWGSGFGVRLLDRLVADHYERQT